MAEQEDAFLKEEEELLRKISEAQSRYHELMEKTADAYEALGFSPTEAERALGKSSLKEWKELQRRAAELDEELFKGRVRGIRKKVLRRRKKRLKRGKGRMIGGRKGWLDAR